MSCAFTNELRVDVVEVERDLRLIPEGGGESFLSAEQTKNFSSFYLTRCVYNEQTFFLAYNMMMLKVYVKIFSSSFFFAFREARHKNNLGMEHKSNAN